MIIANVIVFIEFDLEYYVAKNIALIIQDNKIIFISKCINYNLFQNIL